MQNIRFMAKKQKKQILRAEKVKKGHLQETII